MSALTSDNRKLSACFAFPEDFVGFEGHFPSKKILPGVCQIECVTAMIVALQKNNVILSEVIKAKYLLPVFPLETITVEGSISDGTTDDMILIKVVIKRQDERVTELKLRFHVTGDR